MTVTVAAIVWVSKASIFRASCIITDLDEAIGRLERMLVMI